MTSSIASIWIESSNFVTASASLLNVFPPEDATEALDDQSESKVVAERVEEGLRLSLLKTCWDVVAERVEAGLEASLLKVCWEVEVAEEDPDSLVVAETPEDGVEAPVR